MKRTAITFGALIVVLCALSPVVAQWQGVKQARTYVSSTGNDANTCQINAPCLTFAGAAAKTLAGGEITAINSGAYGNITIAGSLTLQGAPGVVASMGTSSTTTPVVIEAHKSAVVVLRNLQINAALSSANYGVLSSMVGSLSIENCVVTGFDNGIFVYDGDLSDLSIPKLFLNDSIVQGRVTGLAVADAISSINRSRFANSITGILDITSGNNAEAGHSSALGATINDCVITGNSIGISSSSVRTDVENCIITGNSTGIDSYLNGYPGEVNVSNTRISGNVTGVRSQHELMKIRSFGNNRLHGNQTNGTFSSTLLQF